MVEVWLAWYGSGELGASDCDRHIDRSARLGVIGLGECGIVTVLDAQVAARRAGPIPTGRRRQQTSRAMACRVSSGRAGLAAG